MLGIWTESAKFNTKSQRLADQARLILKEVFFSNLEIWLICGQVNCEEYTKKAETLNIEIKIITEPQNQS